MFGAEILKLKIPRNIIIQHWRPRATLKAYSMFFAEPPRGEKRKVFDEYGVVVAGQYPICGS